MLSLSMVKGTSINLNFFYQIIVPLLCRFDWCIKKGRFDQGKQDEFVELLKKKKISNKYFINNV